MHMIMIMNGALSFDRVHSYTRRSNSVIGGQK
jgi:hypothetical protein